MAASATIHLVSARGVESWRSSQGQSRAPRYADRGRAENQSRRADVKVMRRAGADCRCRPTRVRRCRLDLIAGADAPLTIAPGRWASVPTGSRSRPGTGEMRPRSGLAARHGITVLNAPAPSANHRLSGGNPGFAAISAANHSGHARSADCPIIIAPQCMLAAFRSESDETAWRQRLLLRVKAQLTSGGSAVRISTVIMHKQLAGMVLPPQKSPGDRSRHRYRASRPGTPGIAKRAAIRHALPARHLGVVLRALVREGILRRGARRTAAPGRERRRSARTTFCGPPAPSTPDGASSADSAVLNDVVVPAMATRVHFQWRFGRVPSKRASRNR